MGQEMILFDENNNEVKCNIVATWKNNDAKYVAYTDGSFSNGKKQLFVSKVISENEKMKIYDIQDDNEWKYVNDYLENHFYNEVEDYE
jgi:uncharacterized protein YrzB (UPF0473 family)